MGEVLILALLKAAAPKKKKGGGTAGAAAAGGLIGGAAGAAGGTALMARLMRKAVEARASSLKGELEGKMKVFQAMSPLKKIRFLLKVKK